jgi:hypothetical protein
MKKAPMSKDSMKVITEEGVQSTWTESAHVHSKTWDKISIAGYMISLIASILSMYTISQLRCR